MVLLPLIWFGFWYLAYLEHDDCLDALRKVGSADPLYSMYLPRCRTAAAILHSISMIGLGVVFLAEIVLWLVGRRAR